MSKSLSFYLNNSNNEEENLEKEYLNHTPLEKYEYKSHTIYVKREDLVANQPAPPFSKLRGLLTYIQNNARNCDYIGALEPSTNSMYGVAVAWICKILNKKAVVYYPAYKNQNNENRLNVKKTKEMGATLIPLPAGRTTILFYQAKKHLKENYPKSFIVPNGFKGCDELVDATAKEVDEIPDKLFGKNVTWILACGTGSVTSGIIKGLINNSDKGFPKVKLHLAFDRNREILLKRIRNFNPKLNNYLDKIEVINEKYAYGKIYNFDNLWQPIPMNIDYEIKAWKWLMNNLDKVDKTIVFWNIGSSLEKQAERNSVVRHLSMIRGGKTTPYEVFLTPYPHVIKEMNISIRGWYKSKIEPPSIRPRPCYSEHILTVPYAGFCPGRCAWCYVNNGVRGWRSTEVSVIDLKYPDKVRKMIDKLYVAFPLYISSFTESFQGLEKVYHITEKLSQVAVDNNLPILYCSRYVMEDWAIEMLKKNPYSYVQWSVSIIDEEVRKRLSPGCSPLPELFKNIKKVNDAKIYTSFQINPIIPGITDEEELIRILDKAKELGVKHVIFKFIEINYSSTKKITSKLERAVIDKYKFAKFKNLFAQNIGGVKTIHEKYRKKVLDLMKVETAKRNLTMGLCYEYEESKKHPAGISLGPKYQTEGFQCHGRPIPIFYRKNLKDIFQPLKNCYGMCLYCKEKGTRACNNEILLQAKALKYSDLLKLKIEG